MNIKKTLATIRQRVGKKKKGSSSYVLGCSPTASAEISGYYDAYTAYPAVQQNQPIGRDTTAEDLHQGSNPARIDCVKALGESGDPRAIPPLREAILEALKKLE